MNPIIQIFLSPVLTIHEINKFIFFNTVYIPVSLVFTICLYIPFIKLPILKPLIYLLELENFEIFEDISWIKTQFELFLITTLHFIICSIYIGIGIGVISGLNLSTIQFIFSLSIPEEIKNFEQIWDEKANNMLIDPPRIKKEDEDVGVNIKLEPQPVAPVTAKDKIKLKMLENKKEKGIIEEIPVGFEDDDGYSYLRRRKNGEGENEDERAGNSFEEYRPIAESTSRNIKIEPVSLSNIDEETETSEGTEEIEENKNIEANETEDENIKESDINQEFSNENENDETITKNTSL
ncbi:unnamed protein product [Candida verbasci]|uniref:Uncharacterized protein n=1 Tax=Candida verbasci TaxID=1227364 RepID=A0A9W4TQE5_9ASCO|nr:unnamed protein product [Candida verbasci]